MKLLMIIINSNVNQTLLHFLFHNRQWCISKAATVGQSFVSLHDLYVLTALDNINQMTFFLFAAAVQNSNSKLRYPIYSASEVDQSWPIQCSK